MSKKTWIYLLFFAVLVGGFYVFLLNIIDTSKSRLPVLSNVKPFNFTRQDGESVSEKGVDGKVYVAEYFFTTCPGICPKMNTNMKKVYEELKQEKDFIILSHTVDPVNDTVARLKFYADSLGADASNWWFLTGSKEALYKTARESYIIDDPKNNASNIDEDFLHTQFFALVDKDRRVRGIYDGLKSSEIRKLISDARELLQENYPE
ncbi:MAG: SCO family protein [Chitinophagaceae bacterium]|nr:SCO family protein [Chitinophagaceae bacterium]MCW5929495.1 SCO family protein [Chitinophagaceae bacterium]